MYYYEVIECGRRILLTGVLIFFPPGTSAQAAMACIFAFASLLGFELLRPHLDPADSWLYRLVSCNGNRQRVCSSRILFSPLPSCTHDDGDDPMLTSALVLEASVAGVPRFSAKRGLLIVHHYILVARYPGV